MTEPFHNTRRFSTRAGPQSANPFGRAWWDEEAKGFFPQEFAAYVADRLDKVRGKDSRTYWRAIRARVTGVETAPPTVCQRGSPRP